MVAPDGGFQQRIAAAWNCPADVADVVARLARTTCHAPRTVITRADDHARQVFVLADGRARALGLALDGRQILVEEFVPGDIFGDLAVFGASPDGDSAEIVAHGQALTGHFGALDFLNLVERHGCVALAVTRALTRRLTQANRRVFQIAVVSAPGRVHAELLRQGRAADGWRIAPPPVLSELAIEVQSTRETVSRAVSQLEKRGIVRREDGALVIVAPHRLEELVY